jgi:hypothetical protein
VLSIVFLCLLVAVFAVLGWAAFYTVYRIFQGQH